MASETEAVGEDRPISPVAIVRIIVTLLISLAVVGLGFSGWKPEVWLWGGALFTFTTLVGKGYLHPQTLRSIVGAVGYLGAIGIILAIPVFNLALAAAVHGLGSLIGLAWRAIT
ncbi:MAG: hypothetical protein EON91_11785 [Brevundimonas sp.]|uniref:hypothetical protein n=1 Tax=Brevundimonas sp. TaxID=1871086 RepID=UPI001216E422|nr:hypothetical protein [Brevundimonas sp.]RZJ16795.1 MAG: hypothetical protein EON91_11785 [Brevundimonas sp.]